MSILFYVIIYITLWNYVEYTYTSHDESLDETFFNKLWKQLIRSIISSRAISMERDKEFEKRSRFGVKFIDYKGGFNRRIGGMLENSWRLSPELARAVKPQRRGTNL